MRFRALRSRRRSMEARKARQKARHQASGAVERLEARHALATFTAGTWTILGDGDAARPDDTIVIDRNPANARQLRATVNGVVVDVRAAARVKSIRVVGGAGDDTISVNVPGATKLATRLDGGFGNDTISGGDGPDVILGGPGRDTLNGRGGDDDIYGNGGRDALVGSLGDDELFGGAGVDAVRGGAGQNTLDGGLAVDSFFGDAARDVARLEDGERLVGNENTNPLAPVGDAARLKSWAIESTVARWRDMLGQPAGFWWGPMVVECGDAGWAMTNQTSVSARDYSQTPTQTAGVDEGDRVKTDGVSLFAIAGDGIDVLDVSAPDRLGVAAHLALPGNERQLFLDGDRLTVISQDWGYSVDPMPFVRTAVAGRMVAPSTQQVIVSVVDVSVPAAPVVRETTRLDGWFVDARAVQGRIVVVTQAAVELPVPERIPVADPVIVPSVAAAAPVASIALPPVDPPWPGSGQRFVFESEASYRARLEAAWSPAALPGFTVVDASAAESSGTLADPARTSLPVDGGDTSLLSVVSFSVGDDVAGPDAATTAGGVGGRIYAAPTGLYVFDTHVGAWWDHADPATTTNIYKFDLSSAAVPLVAMGSVPGMTSDQFSLDEHEGLLRIATTDGFGTAAVNAVFVMAASAGRLEAVGSVAGLAPGERIYSVRFAGDRGYVSTFRQVDPLFVIDLAEPAAPRVTGELKVPGYSTHLMPLDDTHLLGVGRDVDPATGRDGGLQLSIFSVGDPAKPKRTATYTFAGEWGSWSPASWDHHALGWFAAQGILALPVQEQGFTTDLAVFRIDVNSAAAFTRLGTISHEGTIDRSVRIGDVLYAVSTGRVTAHPLAEPAVLLAAAECTGGGDAWGPIVVF
ncbi:MAG: beta-propeller domain-containing protein [Planctomycetaceae bacterium]